MSDTIKVDTVRLGKTRDHIQGRIGKIRAEIGSLQGDIVKLDAMWEGEAHSAFHAAFLSDLNLLDSQCRALDGIVSNESSAIREYEACGNQAGALAAQLGG